VYLPHPLYAPRVAHWNGYAGDPCFADLVAMVTVKMMEHVRPLTADLIFSVSK